MPEEQQRLPKPEALDRDQDQDQRRALILGGAGFIGSNWAAWLLARTQASVEVFDNLSRPGVRHNLEWLRRLAGRSGRLRITIADVRDTAAVERAVGRASEIYHLAAQVAVTTSVSDPRLDFEVNAGGTLNVLEAARQSGHRPFLLFTSTNKVYGELADEELEMTRTRYSFKNRRGVSESQPLDFHSPYGCSKGAAEQYVRDYARTYGLPTVVLRMSCIAGPRQFGTEDQGWMAHFLYSTLEGKRVAVHGDGRQVRDVLCVDDLMLAFDAVRRGPTGEVYNVGGGAENSVSLLELLEEIEMLLSRHPSYGFDPRRAGDQLVYITDFSKLQRHTGWQPTVGVRETLRRIYQWRRQQQVLFPAARAARERETQMPAVLEAVPRIA
jgi:CDP-paratose 2-epimerase